MTYSTVNIAIIMLVLIFLSLVNNPCESQGLELKSQGLGVPGQQLEDLIHCTTALFSVFQRVTSNYA